MTTTSRPTEHHSQRSQPASTGRAGRSPAGPQPAPQRTHPALLVRLCLHGVAGPATRSAADPDVRSV